MGNFAKFIVQFKIPKFYSQASADFADLSPILVGVGWHKIIISLLGQVGKNTNIIACIYAHKFPFIILSSR